MVNKELIDRIIALEKRVAALENRQLKYVPPALYGPIEYPSKCNVLFPEISKDGKDD